jgi:hypothetical protein
MRSTRSAIDKTPPTVTTMSGRGQCRSATKPRSTAKLLNGRVLCCPDPLIIATVGGTPQGRCASLRDFAALNP